MEIENKVLKSLLADNKIKLRSKIGSRCSQLVKQKQC